MNKPKKPESLEEQVSMIWDALYNDVFHKLKFQDIKINFILTFLALLLTALGIMLAIQVIG